MFGWSSLRTTSASRSKRRATSADTPTSRLTTTSGRPSAPTRPAPAPLGEHPHRLQHRRSYHGPRTRVGTAVRRAAEPCRPSAAAPRAPSTAAGRARAAPPPRAWCAPSRRAPRAARGPRRAGWPYRFSPTDTSPAAAAPRAAAPPRCSTPSRGGAPGARASAGPPGRPRPRRGVAEQQRPRVLAPARQQRDRVVVRLAGGRVAGCSTSRSRPPRGTVRRAAPRGRARRARRERDQLAVGGPLLRPDDR